MRLLVFLFAVVLIVLSAGFTRSDTVAPTIEWGEWNSVSQREIEIVANYKGVNYVVYLGYFEEKNNSLDGSDAIVIRRYLPVIVGWTMSKKVKPEESTMIANYDRKELKKIVEQRHGESELVGYSIWQTSKDPKTGREIMESVFSCLLDFNGMRVYMSGVQIAQATVSIPKKDDKGTDVSNTLVGIKFSLGDAYQILRISVKDLKASDKSKREGVK